MRCFLRRCIFSYNIMSDPDFPKSTLSGLTASPVSLPGGRDLHQGPSSTQWARLCLPPTPIQGVTIHIFISKATPCTSTTNPSSKWTKYSQSMIKKINRMCSMLKKYLYLILGLQYSIIVSQLLLLVDLQNNTFVITSSGEDKGCLSTSSVKGQSPRNTNKTLY